MYAYLDMECLHRHNFCHLRPFFAFFTPLLTSKIQIWKKNAKKIPGNIIFLHMCTINQDHMMHGS